MSCLTLSSNLYLGLPCYLLVRGFHLNIFLTVLVSGILCTWPNQLSLWALIWLTIFLCLISLSNSSLVLILHIWFSFVGPNILLKIFLSKKSNFWIMVSFSTHVYEGFIWLGFTYSGLAEIKIREHRRHPRLPLETLHGPLALCGEQCWNNWFSISFIGLYRDHCVHKQRAGTVPYHPIT